jgi:protein-S-isoprenylcysteine O-methyltransferase Ste14
LRTVFAWGGGAAFVASFAYLGWTFAVTMAVPVPRGTPGTGITAIATDTALFALFAAHHTLFARTAVKRHVARLVTPSLERSTYVWSASILLFIVCAFWQPVGGTLYRHDGPLAWVHAAVVAAGVALTILGARVLSPFELSGIRQATGGPARGPNKGSDELAVRWPYSLVRHPIYLAWLLMVFGPANVTASRFLFACLSSAYLVLAVPLEERMLVREFGKSYLAYKRRVRWRMIPGIY